MGRPEFCYLVTFKIDHILVRVINRKHHSIKDLPFTMNTEQLAKISQAILDCHAKYGYAIELPDAMRIIDDITAITKILRANNPKKFRWNIEAAEDSVERLFSSLDNVIYWYDQVNWVIPEWFIEKYGSHLTDKTIALRSKFDIEFDGLPGVTTMEIVPKGETSPEELRQVLKIKLTTLVNKNSSTSYVEFLKSLTSCPNQYQKVMDLLIEIETVLTKEELLKVLEH